MYGIKTIFLFFLFEYFNQSCDEKMGIHDSPDRNGDKIKTQAVDDD